MSVSGIRILLVDDHIVLRMGLVSAARREADLEVVAEAEDGEEAIEAYRQLRPDVVVLDLQMPKLGGVETIRRLREEFPAVRVLVFSNYASGDIVMQAFEAGASGFVVKEMSLDSLLEGIRTVAKGDRYLPDAVAGRVSNRALTQLSKREIEVLWHIARGLSNKDVASALDIAERTVKVHVTNILSKLRVSDRTQAVLSAIRLGIIEME